jgi:hypothetical protein
LLLSVDDGEALEDTWESAISCVQRVDLSGCDLVERRAVKEQEVKLLGSCWWRQLTRSGRFHAQHAEKHKLAKKLGGLKTMAMHVEYQQSNRCGTL